MSKYKNVIAISIICILIILCFLIQTFISKKNEQKLIITQNNIQITKIDDTNIDINVDGIYTIKDNDNYNTIEISNGGIRVIDANCKDKTCVRVGFIYPNNHNSIIACLPHKLLIQFK
ncbi:MAG: NusG domain II-containing protein [Eubacteriales bacterium]|nr:NusG domain II-containing protein [Eubacteriales bacterium]